jgi:hypothetical protein
VEIEDGGLGLTEEGRERAERMLEEAQAGIDLTDLGETPRLGLAVVGRLARGYNFEVSLRPSAYRGVRAVLIVPQNLITTAPATGRLPGIGASSVLRTGGRSSAAPVDRPTGSQPFWSEDDDEAPMVSERTPSGLPQRRRNSAGPAPVPHSGTGVHRAGVQGAGVPGAAGPDADAESVQPGMWLSAFQGATGGRAPAAAPAATQVSDESSDEVE